MNIFQSYDLPRKHDVNGMKSHNVEGSAQILQILFVLLLCFMVRLPVASAQQAENGLLRVRRISLRQRQAFEE